MSLQACASDCAAQLDDYVLAHILSFVPSAAERLRLAPVCKQVGLCLQGSERLASVCGACMLTLLRGCWQWSACVQQAWGAMVLQETEQRQLLAQLSWLQRRGSVPAGCLRVSTPSNAMSDTSKRLESVCPSVLDKLQQLKQRPLACP